MSMTGYYPHAAQDFHIAGSVVLREIGRIITNLPLNIADHRDVNINARCISILKTFLLNHAELMCAASYQIYRVIICMKMISCDAEKAFCSIKLGIIRLAAACIDFA